MTTKVQKFYETFNFAKMITKPPKLIRDFLNGEINFLKRKIKSNKKILEVGCGYGRLLKILAPKSKEVVGIDFSKKLLKKAKQNLIKKKNIKLKLMDAQKMNLQENSFDYVLCLDQTFGNMPNIELKVFKEMFRVCKKGGTIILSVFSENAKEEQIKNYKRIGLTEIKDNGKAITTKEGFYSRRFTKKDLKEIFASCNLNPKIIKICPINYLAIAKKS